MGQRHLARELALKVLFELEGDGGDVERSLQYHVAESRADTEVADFARTLILGVREHQAELDESVRTFERGLALARRCARLLDEAERRLNELAPAGERPPGP